MWILSTSASGQSPAEPLFSTIDLAIGEHQRLTLSGGEEVDITLISLQESRDDVRGAVRIASSVIDLNGVRITLPAANYHLPMLTSGLRIDCPITRGCLVDGVANPWGLAKDARFRLWPADSPLLAPGTFTYPARQRWFASATQMANEPVFVDRADCPSARKVYYHSGLDFGGVEGMIDIVAASDALVVAAGIDILPGHEDNPVNPRYDVVSLLDDRGWYHRYSHLRAIAPSVRPGERVQMGQKIGVLGKEGGSGGWSHLHFEIFSMQPSGQWGTQEAYAFVHESYRQQHDPPLLAVARPHKLAWAGEEVVLDASRSWSATGGPLEYRWTFTDGTRATGATVRKVYPEPGEFSEILQVTDSQGRFAYDFAVVQVMDREHPERCIPAIHAAFTPTLGIRPGDDITFAVRTFGTTAGEETWDFGDGSAPVRVRSDGNVEPLNPHGYALTSHTYDRPGDYLVHVHRTDEHGVVASARLHVRVDGSEP